MDGNNNFWNVFNLASFIVGLENLYENREQSAQNDVQSANDRQANYLLTEIARLLEDLKNGKNRATVHTTKSGALAIVTKF